MRLSVILCCHNSATRLEPTLGHLAAQTDILPGLWEVLVVDNASTDDTAASAERTWQGLGSPCALRVVHEPRLGLIHARFAGIAAARYEVLSFVDDDNWVCPTWCATVLRLMAAHPGLGVIGGRSEATFVPGQEVPPWFPALQYGYAVGPQGKASGWLEVARPRFYGAGLTLRRAAVDQLLRTGFAPAMTGRSGSRLTAGEDSELCYALAMLGWRFWYEDGMRLKHFMPPGRLTDAYAQKLFAGLGYTSSVEDHYLDLLPAGGLAGIKGRIKRVFALRYLNAVRLFSRHWLRTWPAGSPRARQAAIEASFFRGRLEGLRDRLKNGRMISAQVAGWVDANLVPAPKGGA